MKNQNISEKIEICLQKLGGGEMIVLSDKSSRENEGDVLMAAQFATPEKINFMIKHCRGLVCAPTTREISQKLQLPPMIKETNEEFDSKKTNFTISVDHKNSTTGISPKERAYTLQQLANPLNKAEHFVRPGHIFPLIGDERGLAGREGHTEATVTLLQMAKLYPVGVICEIINDDGSMACGQSLEKFCEKHGLFLLKIEELLIQISPSHKRKS